MPDNTSILISGAGIAGLTLGYWLHKVGFDPLIVEKRPNLDDRGYMIDFYGSGYDVADKMGLLDSLAERHYPIPELTFVNREGRPRAALDVAKFREVLENRHYNFMRGDLADVLHESVQGDVPTRFGTTITHLDPGEHGVRVELSDGTTGTYDLVIGADGIHSNVRRLLWGDESQFEHYLGYQVACSVVDNFLGEEDAFRSHVEPGRQASVYSIRGGHLATFFAWESERLTRHGREEALAALEGAFAGVGWIARRLVEATRASTDLYFDPVSQIKVPVWYKGRVALVGDACQCLTFLAGQGASMAMAGAYILAHELAQADGDFHVAFPAYQDRLKPEIDERQVQAEGLAGWFVPKSRFAIWMLYLFLKAAFLPGFRGLFRRQVGARSVIE